MLNLKSITSLNINGIPLKNNNLSKRIYEYKNFSHESMINNSINDNELCILSIQGLYGYRVGILGLLTNHISFMLSKKNNPTYLQKFINLFRKKNPLLGNDFEIISFILSIFNRTIPIINYGNWNLKNKFENDKIKDVTKNISMPSIYNLKSLYLQNPLYDSGCSIYSNKIPLNNGFEPWNTRNKLVINENIYNKGITWCYFQSENSDKGITIISVNIDDNIPEWIISEQLKQIVKLKNNLENKFNLNVKYYETYLMGDFKIEYNINFLDKEPYNILEKSNFRIISNNQDISSTHFIFHAKDNYYENDIDNNISSSNMKFLDDDILSVDFNDENINHKENKNIENIVENINLVVNNVINNINNINDNYENFKKEIINNFENKSITDTYIINDISSGIANDIAKYIENDVEDIENDIEDIENQINNFENNNEELNINVDINIDKENFKEIIINEYFKNKDENKNEEDWFYI